MGLYPARAQAALNVCDFGAVGNGTTLCDTAISNALAALPATGGTLVFPYTGGEVYLISQSISVDKDYVTLQSQGATIKVNASDPSYALILGATKNIQEAWVIGLRFQGLASTTSTGGGINMRSNGGGIIRCRVSQFGGSGINLGSVSGLNYQNYLEDIWLIQNGYNSGTPGDNLVITTGVSDCEYVRIISYGNSAKNTTRHCFSNSASAQKFFNCHAYFANLDGFNQGTSNSTQIIGGEWENNGRHGINISTTTQNITIVGAHCFGNTHHDINANNVAGLVIESCQCTSTTDDSIALFGTTYGVVANCVITGPTGGSNGITVNTSNVSVHDCYISCTTTNSWPIELRGASGCDVHDNYCSATTTAITETTGANTNNIHDNYLASGTLVRIGAATRTSNNHGYNPVGHAVSQPAVPASTVAQTNTTGCDCSVFVTGGTVSAIAVGGTTTGLTSGTFRVPVGQTITLTYTVAPTWQWFGD